MRPTTVLLSCALLCPLSIAAQPIDTLAWLAGCWRADGGDPGSVEQWLPPAGGTMLGVSRTVRNGRTVAYEFLLIRSTTDGSLEYVATPSGQRTAAFALSRSSDTEVVFENPRHDYPQRVIYAQAAAGRLAARIEGATASGPKVIHYPMTRVRCDP